MIDDVAPFVAEARLQRFADDATLEAALIEYARIGATAQFEAVLNVVTERALHLFASAGFDAPAPSRFDRVWCGINGHQLELRVEQCNVLDISPLLRWATPLTRRTVVDAIKVLSLWYWGISFAHHIYQHSYYWREAFCVIPNAEVRANGAELDFDAMWNKAAEHLEVDTYDDGTVALMGIGNRDEFESWVCGEIAAQDRFAQFLVAPATGPIDRRRSAALRNWARRVQQLSRNVGAALKGKSYARGGECRDLGESAVVVIGDGDIKHLDHYFHATDDMNGERPGIDMELTPQPKPAPGGGALVQAALLALADCVVVEELRRLADDAGTR